MGVGPADAERRHAGPAGAAVRRPRAGPRSAARPHPPTSRRGATARRRAGSAAGRPWPHRHHHLDDPGDAGRRLGVADVRLQRAEPQRRPAAVLPVGGQQRRRPRSGRPAPCRCRAPRPRRRRPAPDRRPPAPGGSPAAAPGRSARSGRWTPRPGSPPTPAPPPTPGGRGGARPTAAPPPRTPTPSDQPVPSAPAPNALHRPSAARPPWAGELDEHRRGGHAPSPRRPAPASTPPPAAPAPARCSATSDDEHAVSTVTAGPSRPSTYATRPDTTLAGDPGQHRALDRLGGVGQQRAVVARRRPARRTPRCRCPAATGGSSPARSSASHATSSSSRCCGSIASASRGEIPNRPASNPAASARKPPRPGERRSSAPVEHAVPAPVGGEAGDGVAAAGHQVPQVLGRRHPAREPAGHRRRSRSARRRGRRPAPPPGLGRAVGAAEPGGQRAPRVGWSNTRVAGSRRPVRRLSRLRSSTASRESKPRSLKARPGSTASGRGMPQHRRPPRPAPASGRAVGRHRRRPAPGGDTASAGPEAPVLEGVGGQVDGAVARRWSGRPVDGAAAHPGVASAVRTADASGRRGAATATSASWPGPDLEQGGGRPGPGRRRRSGRCGGPGRPSARACDLGDQAAGQRRDQRDVGGRCSTVAATSA